MTTSTVTNKIIDTANFKHLVIAEDAVDSIQFTIPKTYDGNDLSAGTVYSLWTIPGGSGDMTELTTTVSGDNLLSVWPLSGAVVSKKGMVEFQLVILVGTTIVWQSKVAHFFVDRRLDPTTLDFTADVLTAHLASVIAARDRAETAADTAEGVLEDTGFVAVAEDLALGASSNIKIVAADKTNIDLVAAAKSNIDALAPRASDMQTLAPQAASIGTLAPVASAIAALDAIKAAISALDLIKSDITGVNGAKTDVSAVAAKLVEIQAVYAKLTAIEALYGKTTEIDALYAELDAIGAKATVASVDNLAGVGRTTETVKKNADDILTKVKLTKMPDGATAVYSQDAWATVDGWYNLGGASLSTTSGNLRITATGSVMTVARTFSNIKGKTAIARIRASKQGLLARLYQAGMSPPFIIIDTSYTIIRMIVGAETTAVGIDVGGLISGDWVELDWIWIGDYSYTDNTLATEASRIANQLGDTTGVGTKASRTITNNGTGVLSDGETLTIGGQVYTFKTALTGAMNEIKIEATTNDSLSYLAAGITTSIDDSHRKTTASPLVTATYATGGIVTTTARTTGILGNSITLATTASTLTLSGSTLTGGTDDVGAKVITQLESSYKGTPKFNGVAFPATAVNSSDPNTLDDYEEGTWTPVLTRFTTPSAHTYTRQNGRYVKIGRKITIWFDIAISATTTAGSGQNRITGIPFAPASDLSYYTSGDLAYSSLFTALAAMVATPGQTYLHFTTTNITLSSIDADWAASGNLVGTISYLA